MTALRIRIVEVDLILVAEQTPRQKSDQEFHFGQSPNPKLDGIQHGGPYCGALAPTRLIEFSAQGRSIRDGRTAFRCLIFSASELAGNIELRPASEEIEKATTVCA
ncbi:MAG: hypothetical protein OXP37_00695 [Chloroflexota bacterium]|nr:hypothetical protein [Chloroflexota bacterium]